MRLLTLAAIIILALQASSHAQQPPSPTAMLTEIYNAPKPERRYFSERFLNQVSIEQLTSILANMRRTFGEALRSEGSAGAYSIVTEDHRIPVTMTLNKQHRIIGLLLKPGIPRLSSPEQFVTRLRQLPGTTALLLTKNRKPVLTQNAETPLAVGSAFKLAVLVTLQEKIQRSEANWSDVITLKPHDISLPSGILQDMPPGAPITLHTLASLMIALSDNTATDALMRYLGRQNVEAIAGVRPMLSTREMFQLKADRQLYARYAKSTLTGRRALLNGLTNHPLPKTGQADAPLRAHDEWYIPLTRICNWLQRSRQLDLMRINPGLASKSDWQRVSYKGGSNAGVLNFSTLLEDANGDRYCLAATWNTQEQINQNKLVGIYSGLIRLIRKNKL